MPIARVNGVDLFFETTGDGPPLLLIAGLASDSASWAPIAGMLSKHFRLIMPDNRGSGRTRDGGGPLSLEMVADDCAALLDLLEIAEADVLGHSMGGAVALMLAATRPERVRKVVVAASAAQLSARNRELMGDLARLRASDCDEKLFYRLFFYWLFRDEFFEDPAMVDEAAELAANYPFQQSREDFDRQIEAALAVDPGDLLEQIKAPILALGGEHDRLVPPRDLAAFADMGARVEFLAGAAHSLHWDDSQGFVAAVASFLQD